MKCTVLYITWEDARWSEKCGSTWVIQGLKIYLWAEGGRRVA